jgi:putative sterol carrier protein
MDLVHGHVDPVHAFLFRKLNPKIAGAMYFCRKAPVVYFIYILVPVVLQK